MLFNTSFRVLLLMAFSFLVLLRFAQFSLLLAYFHLKKGNKKPAPSGVAGLVFLFDLVLYQGCAATLRLLYCRYLNPMCYIRQLLASNTFTFLTRGNYFEIFFV